MQITHGNLATLIERLADSQRVIAPRRRNTHTEYAQIHRLKDADLSELPRLPLKKLFFPPTEPVLSYHTQQGEVEYGQTEPPEPEPTVIFGSRPCDAASLPLLDKVFQWGEDDPFYVRRRAAATIIGISCTGANTQDPCDEACFCTVLGLAPHAADGSDLLLTPLGNEAYIAEICSGKGEQLIQNHNDLFEDSGEELDKATACQAALDKLPSALDLDAIKAWLDEHFDDAFWQVSSLNCVGCGVCTYTCPTCHCFDIIDEAGRHQGVRRKNWDSCQFSQFTRHTSGHNPRSDQASRWRQRIMHKFSYYVERFEQRSCVGCGRCIRACPVQISILEELRLIEALAREEG